MTNHWILDSKSSKTTFNVFESKSAMKFPRKFSKREWDISSVGPVEATMPIRGCQISYVHISFTLYLSHELSRTSLVGQ